MTGKVYLVGAGPGDPGLLTLRGQQCLQIADVVLHDRLVDPRILNEVKANTELVDVGKARGKNNFGQEDINTMLVNLASSGKQVVRLKGGDPFIFGRGGEEALALKHAGIEFEIVPGVTSAIAVPAYAGIPLTHRGTSASFIVVSGSEDPTKENGQIDWNTLASYHGTLVILMGWQTLPEIVEILLANGRRPNTPAALIEWGTLPHQRSVVGALDNIISKGQKAGLSAPIIAVVGEVVSLRDSLNWFDNRPLHNKRILITRDQIQSRTLSQILAQRGAQPIELPTIEIAPPENYNALDVALQEINDYDWVIFTSVNGVQGFFERLHHQGRDSRHLGNTKFCTIGTTTKSSLYEHGITADFVPSDFTSEHVVRAFADYSMHDQRILLPRSEIADDRLPNGLRSMGAHVDDIPVYRTLIPEESLGRVDQVIDSGIDVTIFASSSSVTNLMSLLGDDTSRISESCIVCIGPVTAQTARDKGLRVDIVPQEHTIQAMVEMLELHFTQ